MFDDLFGFNDFPSSGNPGRASPAAISAPPWADSVQPGYGDAGGMGNSQGFHRISMGIVQPILWEFQFNGNVSWEFHRISMGFFDRISLEGSWCFHLSISGISA